MQLDPRISGRFEVPRIRFLSTEMQGQDPRDLRPQPHVRTFGRRDSHFFLLAEGLYQNFAT
jgi:hypothetical protein